MSDPLRERARTEAGLRDGHDCTEFAPREPHEWCSKCQLAVRIFNALRATVRECLDGVEESLRACGEYLPGEVGGVMDVVRPAAGARFGVEPACVACKGSGEIISPTADSPRDYKVACPSCGGERGA